jgi:hypothetical protein
MMESIWNLAKLDREDRNVRKPRVELSYICYNLVILPTFTRSIMFLTPHRHTVVRATVVTRVALENVGDITNDALRTCVVLARAREPLSVVLDVNFTRGMRIA